MYESLIQIDEHINHSIQSYAIVFNIILRVVIVEEKYHVYVRWYKLGYKLDKLLGVRDSQQSKTDILRYNKYVHGLTYFTTTPNFTISNKKVWGVLHQSLAESDINLTIYRGGRK